MTPKLYPEPITTLGRGGLSGKCHARLRPSVLWSGTPGSWVSGEGLGFVAKPEQLPLDWKVHTGHGPVSRGTAKSRFAVGGKEVHKGWKEGVVDEGLSLSWGGWRACVGTSQPEKPGSWDQVLAVWLSEQCVGQEVQKGQQCG